MLLRYLAHGLPIAVAACSVPSESDGDAAVYYGERSRGQMPQLTDVQIFWCFRFGGGWRNVVFMFESVFLEYDRKCSFRRGGGGRRQTDRQTDRH